MAYVPGPVPSGELTNQQIMETLWRELLEIANRSQFAEDVIMPYLHREPEKVLPGMLVHADGSDWNPGSGEGLYRRNAANTLWVFIA